MRVGSAGCDAAESATPFEAVRQVFSSLLGHAAIFDQTMNDGADLARSVLRNGQSTSHDSVDIYHSLLALLATVGSEPVMIGIDDVQWADPMSLGWLQFLSRRLQAIPVHLVLTMRTTRGAEPSVGGPLVIGPTMRRFVIQPLSLEATRSMIDGHFGLSCDATFVAAAHDLTDGNPRMLAGMLNALDETSIPGAHMTAADLDGLESSIIARAVMSRASRLGDGAREFVEAVAVLGLSDIRVVGAVAGVDHDRAARLADLLADLGVLGWGRPIDFAHKFQRQCVVAEIPPTRRSQTHAAAARALTAFGRSITEIASHILETDPAETTRRRAFSSTPRVTRSKRRSSSMPIACSNEPNARHPPICCEPRLHCCAPRSRVASGGRESSSTSSAPCTSASIRSSSRRRPSTSSIVVSTCSRRRRSSRSCNRSAASSRSSTATARRLELVESVCLPAAERPRRDSSQAGARDRVVDHRGSVRHRRGSSVGGVDAELARRAPRLATSIADSRGAAPRRLRALSDRRCRIARPCQDWCARDRRSVDPRRRRARQQRQRARRHCRLHLDPRRVPGDAGQGDRRRPVGSKHLNGDPDSTLRQCIVMERRWFAALREHGNHGEAVADFAVKMAAPGLSDLGFSTSMLLAETTARIRLLEGDWNGALSTLDRLRTISDTVSVENPAFVPWRVGRCAALAELGRLDEGAALAEENLRLAEAFGSPVTLAEALACVARFETAATKIGLLQQAIKMLSGTSAELLRCNLFIELGFARHHAGDSAEARSALREGADQATRLGASRLAGVAGRGLSGVRGPSPATAHVRSGIVDSRQLRVVRLAAEGQTNGAIAETLFINMKTVESHLTRAYRKLGITDRADLGDALGSHPAGGYTIPKVS